jgi:gamma-glutamylcyclotransferase (GGCT)/AIG2-like uncharacterized protein YtfP
MPGTKPAIFVYGTLMDPGVMARRGGQRGLLRRARPAILHGFRRVALRGTPYPTMRRGRGQVRGLWLRVPPAVLRALDRYETRVYARIRVRVRTRAGMRRAFAWMAPAFRATLIPAG